MISRCQLLHGSALGFGHLAFGALAGQQTPHSQARAKRVVFLFMKGGPSHVDTFDPKPLLDRDHGKPLPFALPRVTFAKQGNLLKSPWQFRRYGESGLPVSDLFPNVARCVDDLCILRSVHGSNPSHGGATLKLHTGSDTQVRPSMGSWVTYAWAAKMKICPHLSRSARRWRTAVSTTGAPPFYPRLAKAHRSGPPAQQLPRPRYATCTRGSTPICSASNSTLSQP